MAEKKVMCSSACAALGVGIILIKIDIVNIGLHFFTRMFDLMLPLVVKYSIVAA